MQGLVKIYRIAIVLVFLGAIACNNADEDKRKVNDEKTYEAFQTEPEPYELVMDSLALAQGGISGE